jgi:hypothetical protein
MVYKIEEEQLDENRALRPPCYAAPPIGWPDVGTARSRPQVRIALICSGLVFDSDTRFQPVVSSVFTSIDPPLNIYSEILCKVFLSGLFRMSLT